MFGVDWSDPQTLWLNITNLVLGMVVAICLAVVGFGVLQEIALRLRKRRPVADLDGEMRKLMADGHAMHLPEVGMTMADGGEELKRKRARLF
jgi:hypothetical protein